MPEVIEIQCTACMNIGTQATLVSTAWGYFCNVCADNMFATCANCEYSVPESALAETLSGQVCDACLGNEFTHCRSCELYLHTNDAMAHDGTVYCEACYNEVHGDGMIRQHDYTPRLNFQKMPWENTVYLGCELEINTEDEAPRHAKAFVAFLKGIKQEKTFFFKYDGSLSSGYEIVTHPCTLQAFHKKVKIRKILAYLHKSGATSYESGECGLHVHVSRDWLSMLDVAKLKLFMFRSKFQVQRFSKRKTYRYCYVEEFGIRKLKDMLTGRYEQDGRYFALNSNSTKETVEFRIFRGTLSHLRFMACLQFSEAACFFVKEHGITAIDSPTVWNRFVSFIQKTGRYQVLLKQLKKDKLA